MRQAQCSQWDGARAFPTTAGSDLYRFRTSVLSYPKRILSEYDYGRSLEGSAPSGTSSSPAAAPAGSTQNGLYATSSILSEYDHARRGVVRKSSPPAAAPANSALPTPTPELDRGEHAGDGCL